MALPILRWSPGIIDPLAIRNRWPEAEVVVSVAIVRRSVAVVEVAAIVVVATVVHNGQQ